MRQTNNFGGFTSHMRERERIVLTQLIPITLPLLFHNSPYGGSKPAASRTAAMIPTTKTGVSFPLWYIGCVSLSALAQTLGLGWEQKDNSHPYGQD